MITIKVNNIEITISEKQMKNMKENIVMNSGQIYMRNKQDVKLLSKKTAKSLEDGRKKRLKEAIKDDDMFYLTSMLNNLSIFDVLKLLIDKI